MNEVMRLEGLLDQLLDGIERVMRNGETLSDEFQGLLADQVADLTGRIERLKGEQAAPQPETRKPFAGPQIPTINEQPPSADAQLLWMLAGQKEDAFIDYLRTYPTPGTQELLNNPTELSRVLDYLTAMMPPGEPPVVNGMQHSDLNSSNIWGTAYNPKTGQMKVRFQGGSEYEYDGVPANIYRAFSKGQASAKTQGSNNYGAWWVGKNPSLGAAMNQYIKAGGFPYRKTR